MSKMVFINTLKKSVYLGGGYSSKKVTQLLGAGPKEVYSLPNGDKLKVSRSSTVDASFTIGRSVPFKGNAVVISKTSVNISNMAPMLKAIRQMVEFQDETDSAKKSFSFEEQFDFWPPNR